MIDLADYFTPITPAFILAGDVRGTINQIPDNSVDLIITSPPYFALRDYRTANWKGGNPECNHVADNRGTTKYYNSRGKVGNTNWRGSSRSATVKLGGKCGKCGATRKDQQIGLEPSIESYIYSLVDVFDSCMRILSPTGCFWLNMGDSYGTNDGPGFDTNKDGDKRKKSAATGRAITGLREKNLIGMPWRLALALQAAGWILRSDVIWHKPSPTPESTKDRPTKSHEYFFQFAKNPDYYYDWFAVREPATGRSSGNLTNRKSQQPNGRNNTRQSWAYDGCDTRHLRDVWTIASEGYKGAHFACFPSEFPRRVIKCGISEGGYCEACNRPAVRVTTSRRVSTRPGSTTKSKKGTAAHNEQEEGNRDPKRHVTEYTSHGFAMDCKCRWRTRPGIVFDPFGGTFTSIAVAVELGYYGFGCELSPSYCRLGRERIGKSLAARGVEYQLPKIVSFK